MKRFLSFCLALVFSFVFSISPVFANSDDVDVADKGKIRVVKDKVNSKKLDKPVEKAKELKEKIEKVKNDVKKEIKRNNVITFNEIRTALIEKVAAKTEKTVEEITNLFNEKRSVQKVFAALGLTMKDYVSMHKEVVAEIRAEVNEIKEVVREKSKVKMEEWCIEYLSDISEDTIQTLLDDGYNYPQLVLIKKATELSKKTFDETVTIYKNSKTLKEFSDNLGIKYLDLAKEKGKITLKKASYDRHQLKEKLKNRIEKVKDK